MTRRPANEAQAAGTTRVHGDITIEGTLQKALAGVDVVINAASYTGKSPDLADSINRRGPLNLISACRETRLTPHTYGYHGSVWFRPSQKSPCGHRRTPSRISSEPSQGYR